MAFDYNNSFKRISWTHPWRGGAFHWNEFRFNGGNVYWSYRIGPLLIKIGANSVELKD